jgi:2'-5' RNA ligase
MYKDPPVWDRINSFALVTYIPEPLAGFLDRLRQELVPNCFLRAHVTALPPRPLSSSPEAAWEGIRALAKQFAPFEIQLGNIELFPVSDVIYIQIASGREVLKQIHVAMNTGGLAFREDFPYHPHVTLAQHLKPDEVDELVHVARSRWAECPFPKTFRAEKIVFVQNTRRDEWVDLGELDLGQGDPNPAGELKDLLVG